jgi:hypothetical protein
MKIENIFKTASFVINNVLPKVVDAINWAEEIFRGVKNAGSSKKELVMDLTILLLSHLGTTYQGIPVGKVLAMIDGLIDQLVGLEKIKNHTIQNPIVNPELNNNG